MLKNRSERRRAAALNRKAKRNADRRLSSQLVNTVAAGSLGLGLSATAPVSTAFAEPDACTPDSATSITCSGDQSGGIASLVDFNTAGAPLPGPYDTLNVNNLDAPGIAPGSGPGIYFYSNLATGITINVDTTGTNGVTTTGGSNVGIQTHLSVNGNIAVNNVGNISTDGTNSDAFLNTLILGGDITVTTVGDILTDGTSSDAIANSIGGNGSITVTSTGNINTGTGSNNHGIFNQIAGNGDIVVTSTGNITTGGSDAEGIVSRIFGVADAFGITITNNGNITTTGGGGSLGIDAHTTSNGNIAVSSTGNISTVGTTATGISAFVGSDGDVTVASNGNITTNGAAAPGIYAGVRGNGNISVTTNGSINAADNNAIFVYQGSVGTITVNASGSLTGDTGIEVYSRMNNDAPATINTSAMITGNDGFAIDLRGQSNDVVNLMPGSSLNGAIDFGDNDGADIDTLNFLPGLNGIVMFADASTLDSDPESAPENINFAGGGIVSADGLTAVGVDVSGFAAQNTMINNLIDGVFNSLDSQPTFGSGLGEALGYAHSGETKGVDPDRFRFWKSAFGGYSETEAQDNVIDFEERFIGHVSGMEKGDADGSGVFGVLGGFSRAKVELDFDAGETETDAFFGGLYFKRNAAYARINATFLGGFTKSESERLVGMDIAKGDFDGVFIAPAVTLAASVGSAALPLEIATRISALHWRLDGYTESGSGAPLTVDDRHVTQVNLRGQIALPHDLVHDDGSYTQFTAKLGVDGTIDAGSDDVQASALGVPFSFDATLDDDVKGFAGLAVRHTSAGGKFALGVSGEVQSNADGDWAASGEVSGAFKL